MIATSRQHFLSRLSPDRLHAIHGALLPCAGACSPGLPGRLESGHATNRGEPSLLNKALELNKTAFSGPTASVQAMAGNNLPDWLAPGSPEAAQATTELDNVVQTQALTQLKAIFGAAPTEGERQILLDISGSSRLPPKVREGIYNRALDAVNRRLSFYSQRANAMRGGDYYKPGGSGTPPAPDATTVPDPLGLR
ncbi:hypothetical protein FO470_17250 [Starkeya sp. 3C]|uniref:Uncharacterized protein n=1 Tax=Ancylobacter moscoviensis TaxID=2597768 RepID=A0ABY3DMJ5_9HYPH|nr:hypothetical protein [Ancylobacter moscoviensis]TSJ60498.1 hypothetical protein FO470_17250 [Ancylobacter moscoviensis]